MLLAGVFLKHSVNHIVIITHANMEHTLSTTKTVQKLYPIYRKNDLIIPSSVIIISMATWNYTYIRIFKIRKRQTIFSLTQSTDPDEKHLSNFMKDACKTKCKACTGFQAETLKWRKFQSQTPNQAHQKEKNQIHINISDKTSQGRYAFLNI